MAGDYLSLSGAVLTVICVLILAYWCSRILGKNWIKSSPGKNIKVIERMQAGADRQLLLIKIQTHVYLIGVSPAGIQMLTEIDGELEETVVQEQEVNGSGFHDLIKMYGSLHRKKGGGDK